jgi:hypothetical protein
MATFLHKDEAENGIDALAQLENPRLVPFFPTNFGRESGWVYWITPFIWAFGASPLALRLATLLLSVLTLAAVTRLARQLLGREGAFWTLSIAAILYWLVHLNHLAFRANLYLFLGTLTAAWLLEAHRTNRRAAWLATGAGLGLLIYSYFASGAIIAYMGLLLVAVAVLDARRRSGALWAIGISGTLMVPMILYMARHLDLVVRRPRHVVATDLRYNLRQWLRAWLVEGDTNIQFNLPGRPILGPWLGILLAAGLIAGAAALLRSKRRGYLLAFVGWAIGTWLPSFLSDGAPHFLRASGMTVAITVVLGGGAWMIATVLRRWIRRAPVLAGLVPCVLLISPAYNAFVDFHQGWIEHPDTYFSMERHVNTGINYVRDATPADHHVYISPFKPTHAVIKYRQADLAPRPVGAFDSHQCLVIPATTTNYVSLTIFEPGLQAALSAWGKTTRLQSESREGLPRYTVLEIEPDPQQLAFQPDAFADFGETVRVGALKALDEHPHPGDTLTITLGIQPLQVPDRLLSIFLHLYGDPTPYEGGEILGQADSQICASYPATLWKTGEMIVQTFYLKLPAQLTPATYTVAMGVYVAPDGARLPFQADTVTHPDYYALHQFSITGAVSTNGVLDALDNETGR